MTSNINIDQQKDEKETKDPMEVLEEALIICGFGKFHIHLLVATMFSMFSNVIATTTSSYILPIAECDLDMNNVQKGLLNAMPFFGQVGASLFTGFLIDMFGRRVFLIGGNFALFLLTIIEGSSQSYMMLLSVKCLQGVALSLSWSAMIPLLTELIGRSLRDRVLVITSAFVSLSLILAALLGWAILPLQIHLVVWKGYFELHAWNIYIYVCSIWSLMAVLFDYYLPESPKYLLSHGQENEALEVLRTIYQRNTGNTKETFPIKVLNHNKEYSQTKQRTLKLQLEQASTDVKQLFRNPLLFRLVLITFISFICLLTYTSLRLWYPQLSTIVENYYKDHNESAKFCVMIDSYKSDLTNITIDINIEPTVCIPKLSGSDTYINGILMGVTFFLFICISACVIDCLGQKLLMLIGLLLCGACSSSVYWASSSLQIALLISTTCALMQTFLTLLHNLLVRIFPTTVRALAISIIVMMGRVGSLTGNILFPILLELGCVAPFVSLTAVTLCVAFLIFLLPNPNKENCGAGDK